PWGTGSPGWHIECSCISMKNLGEYLDIHCGGVDNAFPHHTNEIAQSEAYLGHEWCGHWFHVHHLNTDSGKMSKSKGEFLTVSLLEEKGFDPLVYRFFCLQSHYRKSLVFSWENLENAKQAYEKLAAKIAGVLDGSGEIDGAKSAELKKNFTEAMDNDLNTALAVTAVYDVLKADVSNAAKLALIKDFDRVLSLGLIEAAGKISAKSEADEELPEEVAALAEQRKAARKEKNFALADELRDKIAALGYVITETREGTKITIANK
ncbi:MAG: cysteine--tRNA ligase, partial [Ruminococcus sp.]|nr:cysteine--tRNA ligase [Ruminococcus sp.]